MDTYFRDTMMLLLEGFRQHFPAEHFAYFRAILGPGGAGHDTEMHDRYRTMLRVRRPALVKLGTLPGRVSLGSAWGQPDAGDPPAAAAGGQRLPLGRLVGGGGYHAHFKCGARCRASRHGTITATAPPEEHRWFGITGPSSA